MAQAPWLSAMSTATTTSNAISGVTIVGAIALLRADFGTAGLILGLIALIFATINCVGGFMVTDRMLAMFSKKKKAS